MADSLWEARYDTSAAKAALEAYQTLLVTDSASIHLCARLAQAYYYNGHYLAQDPLKKDSLFLRGYKVSQTILDQNSEYHELLFSTGDENIAIRGLDATYLDALYWGMANYGQWLSTKGTLIRLGQRQVIWTTLEHIHDLDSNYYYGAYYRYKGALLSRDPEFMGDTTRIRESFDLARQIAPDYLGNNTLMAAFYCPLTQNKNLFYKLLTDVLTAATDPKSAYYAENLREKHLAEHLMIKAEKEKWFK